jgi:hypothetical protein
LEDGGQLPYYFIQNGVIRKNSSLFFNQRTTTCCCKYKILLNSGNLMISIGYTSQRLSFLMSLKVGKLAGWQLKFERVIKNVRE